MHYFLIPVYNESENIKLLHDNLINTLQEEKKYYVFVDDGSIDNSAQYLQQLFTGTDFIVLGDGKNHGPGYSFNLGFEWILNHSRSDSDIIITMEADNTSDITILPKMTGICKLDFDLVLASIYSQGGRFEKTSFIRVFLSVVANIFLRYLFNIKVQTLSSFYRVYKISLVKRIKDHYKDIIREKGFLCMIEILIKAIDRQAGIIEVPMILRSQVRKGKSKMKLFKTSLSYIRFITQFKFRKA